MMTMGIYAHLSNEAPSVAMERMPLPRTLVTRSPLPTTVGPGL